MCDLQPFHTALNLCSEEQEGLVSEKNKAAHSHPLVKGLFLMLGCSNGCFVYFRTSLRSRGLADPPQLVAEDQPVDSVRSELQRSKVL